MVEGLNLLLTGGNAYLCLLSPLFQLFLGETEFNGVLIVVNLCCIECEHAYVDRNDGFRTLSQ